MNISFKHAHAQPPPAFKGAILVKHEYLKLSPNATEEEKADKAAARKKIAEVAKKSGGTVFTIGMDDESKYRMGIFYEPNEVDKEEAGVDVLNQEAIQFEHLMDESGVVRFWGTKPAFDGLNCWAKMVNALAVKAPKQNKE